MLHVCEIPEDLVLEILTRLPRKSVMRFKCVSKKWSSRISSRYFGNRFLKATRQKPPRIYMSLVRKDKANTRVLLLTASLDNNCLVFDLDLTLPGMRGLNVVRGLMCYSVSEKACVYNPTTRQLLTLPAVKSDIIAEQDQWMFTEYYIGHDPVNDQYKLLCTTFAHSRKFKNIKSEHWVFLLEEQGGSWKKVVVPLEDYLPHVPSRRRWLSINGSVVHYMAWTDYFTRAIVSFDIRSEELTTIPVPEEAQNLSMTAAVIKAGLVEYDGKIALFDHTNLKVEGLVNLWVLEDAGKKEWSKKTLVLQPCQRHLVHETGLAVNGTTHDGRVILAPWMTGSQFYILIYDMKLNDLSKVEINGVPDSFSLDKEECHVHYKFMDESIINLET